MGLPGAVRAVGEARGGGYRLRMNKGTDRILRYLLLIVFAGIDQQVGNPVICPTHVLQRGKSH